MPEWCTVNLEQKPRSIFQASLLAASHARTQQPSDHRRSGINTKREEGWVGGCGELLGSSESWRQQHVFRRAVKLCVGFFFFLY